ncbi:histidine kinase [Chromatium okenii]|uniref:sensor histidine kinase n=1 Tax=Chromatium okenii TaxID=61644 RepID=UPI001907A15B|nr:ATP-binding protein [Chromatium okenii]MBK1640746.1 histidine kinase [Chromatium okenii]
MPAPAITIRYAELLQQAVFAEDSLAIEAALTAAADLGRELVVLEIPLEEVGEMHHEALIQMGKTHPELLLAQVAERITVPLMEAYMAYSLAFRVQLEHRTEMIVNARLEQSRRLEAIGTLAAGIAHDFNNILGIIVGFSELLGDELAPDSSAQHHLSFIQQASFRARDLIARMLTFARTMADTPTPVEIVTLISDTILLLRASLPIGIRIECTTAVPDAWVLAEASQIQQILMNLCINAADAIGSQQGVITVDLKLLPATPTQRAMVRLTVQDDGEGMPPDICQRVFDPFFTTKAPGKGSGLGLSVIHGLVGKLGGMIAISSTPGVGSRFIIDLPQLVDSPARN